MHHVFIYVCLVCLVPRSPCFLTFCLSPLWYIHGCCLARMALATHHDSWQRRRHLTPSGAAQLQASLAGWGLYEHKPPCPSTDAGPAAALWQPAGEGKRSGKKARHRAWLASCTSALGYVAICPPVSSRLLRLLLWWLGLLLCVLKTPHIQHWLCPQNCSKDFTHHITLNLSISPLTSLQDVIPRDQDTDTRSQSLVSDDTL